MTAEARSLELVTTIVDSPRGSAAIVAGIDAGPLRCEYRPVRMLARLGQHSGFDT